MLRAVRPGVNFVSRFAVLAAAAALWPASLIADDLPEDALLLAAARQGNIELFKEALKLGGSPRAFGGDGGTILIGAVHSGSEQMLREALALRPEIDARGPGGMTALMLSIVRDQPSAFDRILREGADLDVADADGATPLLAALKLRREAMASTLVRLGAHVDRADSRGATPLMVATERGDVDRVRQLLARSRDPNALDAERRSALFIALFERQPAVALLLVRHARVDVASPVQGYPPRFYAEQFGDSDVVEAIDRRLGLSGG